MARNWKRWRGIRGWTNWALGAVAFHFYMSLPWVIARRCHWLLPRVGDYAYWNEAVEAMKADQT